MIDNLIPFVDAAPYKSHRTATTSLLALLCNTRVEHNTGPEFLAHSWFTSVPVAAGAVQIGNTVVVHCTSCVILQGIKEEETALFVLMPKVMDLDPVNEFHVH